VLTPGASIQASDEFAVSDVAIRSTPIEDLYIMPVDWQEITLPDASQVIQVSLVFKLNPLILWIWIGGAIVLLGGLISFWPSMRPSPQAGENAGTKAAGE